MPRATGRAGAYDPSACYSTRGCYNSRGNITRFLEILNCDYFTGVTADRSPPMLALGEDCDFRMI